MIRQRLLIVLFTGVGLVGVCACLAPKTIPRLVYNATASVPVGYYRIIPLQQLARGQLVLIRTPQSVRDLADQRRYLPKSVPMLKTVAALAGDTVCAAGPSVSINGQVLAQRFERDHQGRPLPQWTGCQSLAPGDVFLLNAAPDSFDSRYFGVVKRDLILGQASPL